MICAKDIMDLLLESGEFDVDYMLQVVRGVEELVVRVCFTHLGFASPQKVRYVLQREEKSLGRAHSTRFVETTAA